MIPSFFPSKISKTFVSRKVCEAASTLLALKGFASSFLKAEVGTSIKLKLAACPHHSPQFEPKTPAANIICVSSNFKL
jgi:hypothetical protein